MVTGTTPNWQSRQYNSVILVFFHIQIKKDFFVFEYISPSQLSPYHRETPSLYSKQTQAQTKLPLRTLTNLTQSIRCYFELFSGCFFNEDNRAKLFCSHCKQIVEYYLRFYETILLYTYFLKTFMNIISLYCVNFHNFFGCILLIACTLLYTFHSLLTYC